MSKVNGWIGIWKTRDGTVVEIQDFGNSDQCEQYRFGSIIKANIISAWDITTGDHIINSDLDLMKRKRDCETWD